MRACVRAFVSVCMRAYLCVYVSVCACACVVRARVLEYMQ